MGGHMGIKKTTDKIQSGQDRKKLPALGTNQIAGFGGFRPLASLEKNIYQKVYPLCIPLYRFLEVNGAVIIVFEISPRNVTINCIINN